jgi:hypothetical protein
MTNPDAIGIGDVHFYSYWVTFTDGIGRQFWEGMVRARERQEGGKTIGLEIYRKSMEPELVDKLRIHTYYTMKFEKVWEVLETRLLSKGKDDDKDETS